MKEQEKKAAQREAVEKPELKCSRCGSELAKEEASKNMYLSYRYKNRGLEIKMKTMELLHEQVVLLAEKSKECKSSDELYRIQEVMGILGQAIIPD